jgi:hypothetical protein
MQKVGDASVPTAGIFLWVFTGQYALLTILGTYFLVIELGNVRGVQRNQVLYVLLGCAFGLVGGSTTFPPALGIVRSYPYGIILVPIYSTLITYAILQFRLLDFGLLVRWGIAYTFLVGSLAGVLFGVLFIMEKISRLYFGGIPGIPTLVATAVIVASYEPLRKWTRTFVDRVLFDAPDLHDVLNKFSEVIHQAASLSNMVEGVAEKLKEIWHVDRAGIALWNPEVGSFSFLPPGEFEGKAIHDIRQKIDHSDFLVKTLENERRLFKEGVIIQDEVTALANRTATGERATLWKIRRTMRQVGAALCAPIMDGRRLIGFIILSQKNDRTIFNDEDKKILSRVSEMISADLKSYLNRKDATWPSLNPSQTSTAG